MYDRSLIWKPPPHVGMRPFKGIELDTICMLTFPKDRSVPGYITGYVRRFWQVCVPKLHDILPLMYYH
jgi:hypothetical protein